MRSESSASSCKASSPAPPALGVAALGEAAGASLGLLAAVCGDDQGDVAAIGEGVALL